MIILRNAFSRVVFLALAVGAATHVGEARASGPCICDSGWSVPPSGAMNVPLNARFLVSWPGADLEQLVLYRRESEENFSTVEITVEEVGDLAEQRWVIPVEPMTPLREYALEAPIPGSSSTFTILVMTGESTLEEGRVVEVESDFALISERVPGACEDHIAGRMVTSSVEFRSYELSVVVNAEENTTHTLMMSPNYPWFGDGSVGGSAWAGCLRSFPGAEADVTYAVHVRAFDVGGLASEAVLETEVKLGLHRFQSDGSLCRISAQGGAPSSMLLSLALMFGGLSLARRWVKSS